MPSCAKRAATYDALGVKLLPFHDTRFSTARFSAFLATRSSFSSRPSSVQIFSRAARHCPWKHEHPFSTGTLVSLACIIGHLAVVLLVGGVIAFSILTPYSWLNSACPLSVKTAGNFSFTSASNFSLYAATLRPRIPFSARLSALAAQ